MTTKKPSKKKIETKVKAKPKAKPTAKPKRKPAGYIFGRPSKYDPSFCEVAIEIGKNGQSWTSIAAALDITRETIYEWAKIHPDFSDAIALSRTYSQKWWEEKGRLGLESGKFNGALWSRNMSSRFPQDWRESKDINHGVQDTLADLMREIEANSPPLPFLASGDDSD
jgi:hypothetical protein